MITIKNRFAIEKMSQAGRLLARLFVELKDIVQPGITTGKLDSSISEYLDAHGLISCTKGYHGYRHVSCISINDEVVHGIPGDRVIAPNDIVKVDICASFHGYCADMARSFVLGTQSKSVLAFLAAAQNALDKGIQAAVVGNRISDISVTIQREIEKHGYGIVREFAGHGIGKKMHEDPEILNYGESGRGPVIKPGMAFALEPMMTMGKSAITIDNDGWTVRTADKSLAAHVEDTIIVTENEPLIITREES